MTLLLNVAVAVRTPRVPWPRFLMASPRGFRAAVAGRWCITRKGRRRDDPPLSELGQAGRGLALCSSSGAADGHLVSTRQRTALTAADVAKTTGVTPQAISLEGGGAAHIAAVAKAVQQAKGVVLVVGHSNTVPAIIKALGGPSLPDICDATYSHLFTLTPGVDAQPATLVVARFGANEPPAPTSCGGMIPR
jgi:hypothetical protein